MTVRITPNDKGNPPGKLADAELHFTDGPLAGLKLIGFAVWERRASSSECPACEGTRHTAVTLAGGIEQLERCRRCQGTGRIGVSRNVTFPARQYSINGERRSFALLRPIVDAQAQDRIRDLILQAYADHETAATKTA